MEQLTRWFESFLNELPPLLQLILGMLIAVGMFKLISLAFDAYQKRKNKNE